MKQAETLSDIYQQQVMDNLAMFVHDSNALPYFSYPKEGASFVNDQGALSASPFNAFRIATGGEVSRQMQDSWTMTPVTDPHKLALMRCAYQIAVRNCGNGLVSECCPDCDKRFEEFNSHGHAEDANNCPDDKSCVGSAENCLNSHCWFCVGCKRDVPKCCKCNYVGHYCGVYVWVPPGEGRNELAKLTLAILDYAVYDPAEARTKQVTYYLRTDRQPATALNADTVVTAVVNVEEQIGALLDEPIASDLRNIDHQLKATQADRNRIGQDQVESLENALANLSAVKELRDAFEQKKFDDWRAIVLKAEEAIKLARCEIYKNPGMLNEKNRGELNTKVNNLLKSGPARQATPLWHSQPGLRSPDVPRRTTITPGLGGVLQLQQDLRQVTPLPTP